MVLRTKLLTLYSRFLAVFFSWCFAHICFDFGRGPITSPGPAMVLMDRKDLNSKNNNKKVTYPVSTWLVESWHRSAGEQKYIAIKRLNVLRGLTENVIIMFSKAMLQ